MHNWFWTSTVTSHAAVWTELVNKSLDRPILVCCHNSACNVAENITTQFNFLHDSTQTPNHHPHPCPPLPPKSEIILPQKDIPSRLQPPPWEFQFLGRLYKYAQKTRKIMQTGKDGIWVWTWWHFTIFTAMIVGIIHWNYPKHFCVTNFGLVSLSFWQLPITHFGVPGG